MKNTFKRIFVIMMLAMSVSTLVACGKKKTPAADSCEKNPNQEKCQVTCEADPSQEKCIANMTMVVVASADSVSKEAPITVSATITGSTDISYTWSVSDDKLVSITDNTLSVIKDITIDTLVTITATSNINPYLKASKTILVKAPFIEGQVGDLTSEMIQEVANSSITVTGNIVDFYQDFNSSINNSQTQYDFTVEMSEGSWSGTWWQKGKKSTAVTDIYRKGTGTVTDSHDITGAPLTRLYIDKNNEVQEEVVKNYLSIPETWEYHNMWNHLGNLNIEKFTYDPVNNVYGYSVDVKNEDDLYLMTYLSFSLTPMLEDTLDKLYFVVEDGKITKLLAQTEILYYGADTQEDADAMSYTTVEITFSKIGETVVAEPTKYEAPLNADILQSGIDKLKNATSYTFKAVDTTTYAPSADSGDYQIESASSNAQLAVNNYTSSVGSVGTVGFVTADAVLLATTGKYSYTQDGNEYHTEFSGYKNNTDGTYDYFEYDTTLKTLAGKRKYTGDITSILPKFDFSINLFKYAGMDFDAETEQQVYRFTLQETAITRDLAMEVSLYRYAKNGASSIRSIMTINVDEDGNILSIVYPYSITSGTYLGYVTTRFSNINETVIEEGTFDGYVQRVIATTWDQLDVKYYSPDFSTLTSTTENAAVVLPACFGTEAAATLPTPADFFEIFGDSISGPFYDWKAVGTDENGDEINHGYISLNATSSNYDENSVIQDYDEIMDRMIEVLGKKGYHLSPANTMRDYKIVNGHVQSRYVTVTNDVLTIVAENINTKFIYVSIYTNGDWTLKRS